MKKLIRHIRRWNIWRKYNGGSRMHKFLVLIGFMQSPTMRNVILPEEPLEWGESLAKGFSDGMRKVKERGVK